LGTDRPPNMAQVKTKPTTQATSATMITAATALPSLALERPARGQEAAGETGVKAPGPVRTGEI
jgi:hypothetical protein